MAVAPYPNALQIPNADGLVKEAQETLNLYLQPGLGSECSVKAYSDTSEKYDGYMVAIAYSGPREAAEGLAEQYPQKEERERIRILDIAAGTGLVGVELQKLGFKVMDALDPSEGMLQEAKKRGIYGTFYQEYITDTPLAIEANSYDAVTISGGMGENMIPARAYIEMARLVKPGGYIVNVMRAEHIQCVSEFAGHLDELMERLEKEGRWRLVSRTLVPNFVQGKDALRLVHQVLA